MDFLAQVGQIAFSYGPPFLFVLTIVVFFHELGHFLVARWCGVGVKAFSIGFGPELFGFNDKHGTRWRVAAIPLGGYVKFIDDDNAASIPDHEAHRAMSADEKAKSFLSKPVWQRAAVVAAGPLANFLLAIVIFAGLFMTNGRAVVAPKIGTVVAESPAAVAGIQAGDVVVSVDGKLVESFGDIQRLVMSQAGAPLEVVVDRAGTPMTFTVTPKLLEEKTRFGMQRRGILGIQATGKPEDVVQRVYSPPMAVWEGTKETWFVLARTGEYLYRVIVGVESADQLGGPLRVAQISGEVAVLGLVALINLTAILSVSIGFINLMPIPMLDGGHLVFYAAEALRGKPISERGQEFGYRIGLALVLMLFIFATWNDLVHFASL